MIDPENQLLRQVTTEDALREANVYVSVHHLFNCLTSETVEQIAQSLLASIMVTSEERLFDLCNNFLEYLEIKPTNIEPVAQLLRIILAEATPDNLIGKFRYFLFRSQFDLDHISILITSRLTQIYFFYKYWDTLGYTEEEMVEGVAEFYSQSKFSEYSVPLYYILYGQLIQEHNPELFNEIHEFAVRKFTQRSNFQDAFHNTVCFSQSLWEELIEAVGNDQFPDEIATAIWNDDIEKFRHFLEDPNFDINQKVRNITFLPTSSIVHEANLIEYSAYCGSGGIFHLLWEKGADVKTPTQSAFTLPQLSTMGGNTSIIMTLIRSKFDFTGAAASAVKFRQKAAMEFVIRVFPFEIDDQVAQNSTCLAQACATNSIEMILELIARGADINHVDAHGQTPLHYAVINGKRETTRFLLKCPTINASIKDRFGSTPLHLAAEYGHTDVIMSIYEKAPEFLNARTELGFTPLMMAAYRGKLRAVHCLQKIDEVDVNASSKWQMTALHVAVQRGYPGVVGALLGDPRVDANARDCSGKTALHLAAETNCLDLLRPFLESQADLNAEDSEGWTALHLAAENGFAGAVRALLASPAADPNARDFSGLTPLHYAARNGKVDAVRAILERDDIDLFAQDRRGRTALDYAAARGFQDVSALLGDAMGIDPADVDGPMLPGLCPVATLGMDAMLF